MAEMLSPPFVTRHCVGLPLPGCESIASRNAIALLLRQVPLPESEFIVKLPLPRESKAPANSQVDQSRAANQHEHRY
jgi:hypothetical protein